jgi:catechol 2,3-dioxygenase-like lactoylglutathione lyase family enzyme
MAIRSLHHVQVNVPANRETEALRFYGELLGMQAMPRPQSLSDAGRAGAWFRCGNQELHVFFNPNGDTHAAASSQHPALIVDDLAGLRVQLAADGCEIEEAIPIEGRERFFTRDPGGNRIEFLALRDDG